MGFLDSANDLISRGVASAGRGTKMVSLKAQAADLRKTRKEFMSQLGEALYPQTSKMPKLKNEFASLYSQIEATDAQIASLEREMAAIEQQASLSSSRGGDNAEHCPSCGGAITPDDAFCPNCGAKIERQAVPLEQNACPSCGSPLEEGAVFCTVCGASVSGDPADPAMPATEEAGADALVDAFCPECGSRISAETGVCPSCGYDPAVQVTEAPAAE